MPISLIASDTGDGTWLFDSYWLCGDNDNDRLTKNTIRKELGTGTPYLEAYKAADAAFGVDESAWGALWMRGLWDLSKGWKDYVLTLALAERLALTRLQGLRAEDLRLPFPSVVFRVPGGVDFGVGIPFERYEYDIAICEHTDNRGLRYWLLDIAYDVKESSDGEEVDGFLFLPLPDGKRLAEATREAIFTDNKLESLRPLVEFVANVVLYASNSQARSTATNKEWQTLTDRIQKLPSGSKKERLKERRRSLSPDYKITIGEGVSRLSDESQAQGQPLAVRCIVHGHWKRQAHGPERSLRRLIWVEPYWRGPELAPETAPTRILQ